jgi:hypothetical protein
MSRDHAPQTSIVSAIRLCRRIAIGYRFNPETACLGAQRGATDACGTGRAGSESLRPSLLRRRRFEQGVIALGFNCRANVGIFGGEEGSCCRAWWSYFCMITDKTSCSQRQGSRERPRATLGTATSRSQHGFLFVDPGTTGPSPESIASSMDSSSVYGFIKVPVAALRSRQQLGVTLACMSCSQQESNLQILDEDVIFQFAHSSLLAIRKNYSDWIY